MLSINVPSVLASQGQLCASLFAKTKWSTTLLRTGKVNGDRWHIRSRSSSDSNPRWCAIYLSLFDWPILVFDLKIHKCSLPNTFSWGDILAHYISLEAKFLLDKVYTHTPKNSDTEERVYTSVAAASMLIQVNIKIGATNGIYSLILL